MVRMFLLGLGKPQWNNLHIQMIQLITVPIPPVELFLGSNNLAPRKQNMLNWVGIKGIVGNLYCPSNRCKLVNHLIDSIKIELKRRTKLLAKIDSLLGAVVATLNLRPNNTDHNTRTRAKQTQ